MLVNCENKYCEKAEYFYNPFIEMYCIIDTAYCSPDLVDLEEMFESPDLLVEVETPEYITEDYEAETW